MSSTPRRILYLDPAPAVGGSVISLYHLVKGLDRTRFEPVVILRHSNSYADRFRACGVRVIGFGPESPGEPSAHAEEWSSVRQGRVAALLRRSHAGQALVHLAGFYLQTLPALRVEADELATVMQAERPDLIHLNDVVCVSRAGIMAARRCRIPAICHIRAMAWRNHYDRWLSRYLRGVICISQAVDRFQRGLGGRIEPSWVVYNGLDLDDFAHLTASAAAVRAEFAVGSQQPLIGCVARLVAWKGVHVFIQALAQVVRLHPEVHALIVGSPEANTLDYAQALSDQIAALGLTEHVSLIGYRADIAGLLGALDILVHASIMPEPFGRILIEGMAAGATVIGTRAGAVPEIIEEGVSGLLVAPDDAQDMARAMLYVLEHPDQRAAWRQAAQRTVRERFTVERYVRGVERVYEDLLG